MGEVWLSKTVIWRWVIVAILFIGGIFWGYKLIDENRKKLSALPIMGNKNADDSDHSIADFNLIDQDGKPVTGERFKNKIYVADFFFTTCPGICPMMGDQMERIEKVYKDEPHVLILSHTVKPEEDSIPVLKEYSKSRNADNAKWIFATGEKKQIEDLAIKSYLVGGMGDTTNTEFVHTQYFALVDPEKHIRGIYDGTDSVDVDRLINDIAILLEGM